ncbi:MAG: pyruvate, phosphate dikinase, partial [Dethiobacteria bacterium]
INAQGEDVVAGIRTPEMIDNLKEEMPEIYDELIGFCKKLERHYKDMQDIEFTIEEGKLYFLQTRTGKRTAASAVKVAVDLVKEGIITREEAILRIQPDQLEQLLHRQIDERAKLDVIAGGLPASPGAASGQVVFDADTAQEWGEEGRKVILVRTETTPDDIHGMIAAEGILTSRGGMTSHAAVVARGMGKPCVCGCESIRVDNANQCFQVDGRTVAKGEVISIDGATGRVIWGEVPMVEHRISGDFQTILDWADKARTMKVRANADTPKDAARAIELGAEGIGLCRTEHMFFSPERLPIVQEMILAESLEKREAALQRILPFQRDDFKGILKAMAGYPVTIRLLDPPLHEFLPDRDELLVQVNNLRRGGESAELKEKEALWQKVNAMHEFNPMLGHRGCRLGLVFPEIYRMQVRAILEAAAELIREGFKKTDILPEIMIPLVGNENEIRIMREVITKVMAEVEKETSIEFSYPIGTMIELPRACMAADQIAGHADFFSFGTNDLTQTTFGFSRDDAEGKFLPHYLDNNILARNPFMEIDREGVGGLVQIAVEKGRALKPDLKLGICGEHGGNPASVNFFQDAGLDYVSCSPFRVPVARLAAAQAALSNKDQ